MLAYLSCSSLAESVMTKSMCFNNAILSSFQPSKLNVSHEILLEKESNLQITGFYQKTALLCTKGFLTGKKL